MTKIDGTTVLLTGATGGIGQAIARALAARGATLVLTGRRTDVLEPLAAELRGRTVAADLADREAVVRLAREAGEIDILVSNAGLPASGRLDDYAVDEVDRAIDVNLRAAIVLGKLLSEPMVQRGHGHLLFVSSLAGKTSQPGMALYSATKFGLRGFARGMREDLRDHGVGVSTVFPGFIRDAGMFAEADVTLPPGTGTRTPDDVAAGVVKAIEGNRAELEIAPLGLRVGTALAALLPEPSARIARRLGSMRVAADMAAGQRHKR
ncbi:MAG: short-chain dehydrogenase/reductase [Conexibacter sp.]|nr:short-chain dehydrogenase/reductase [Conexibacter sp.]